MVSLRSTQIGAALSLVVAGAAHAQASPNGFIVSTIPPPGVSRDVFAGRQLASVVRSAPPTYMFGARTTAPRSLSLHLPNNRREVEGPGGWRLDAVEGTPYGAGAQLWTNGGWSRAQTEARAATKLRLAASWSSAFGVDTGLSNVRLGGALGYSSYQDDLGGGFNIDARGWSGSINAGYTAPGGAYVQGSLGYAPKIKLNRTRRPGAQGQTSFGVSRARVAGGAVQAGITLPLLAGWEGGPYVSIDYLNVDMAARVGRGGVPVGPQGFGRTLHSLGAEGFGHWGRLTPSLQLAYVHVDPIGSGTAMGAMAAVRHPSATRTRPIDSRWRDHVLAGAAVDGSALGFTWRAQFEGRMADQTDLRTGLVLSKAF